MRTAVLFFFLQFFYLHLSAQYRRGLLFGTDSLLELKIVANWKGIRKDAETARRYHRSKLYYTNEEGQVKRLDVKIRARGNFRRKTHNCNFPPLHLKFKERQVVSTIFEGQQKIKLVSHCQNRKKHYEEYVLQEYLCYRLYNMLTEKSLKVRLAKIEYIDSASQKPLYKKYGFFIEGKKKMALRVNRKIFKVVRYEPSLSNRQVLADLSLFQFLIANTDWSIKEMHNIFFISGKKQEDKPVPVPYDFDWSGLVRAVYAKPNPILPIEDVEERLYRGYCITNYNLMESIKKFNDRKAQIMDCNNRLLYLSQKTKARNLKYIEDFYKAINNKKVVKIKLLGNCRD